MPYGAGKLLNLKKLRRSLLYGKYPGFYKTVNLYKVKTELLKCKAALMAHPVYRK
jgi:hypothetical protein